MNLDLTALRTLVTAVDLKGFGHAARRLHRSPGAVSLQIKALEERVGTPLFVKSGRQQVLTDAGELLVGFARRLLQLNDEALLALEALGLDGHVRFGMPQDFAHSGLPQTLAQFGRAHPAVRIDVRVDRSGALLEQLRAGALDLALAYGAPADGACVDLGQMPTRWLGRAGWAPPPRGEPIPLLLLEQPCVFRQMAIEALDRAKRPWRVALTSASVSAIWAAAEAGLGITARSLVHVPDGIGPVADSAKLPKLATVKLSLHQDRLRSNPAVDHLAALVEEVVRGRLG